MESNLGGCKQRTSENSFFDDLGEDPVKSRKERFLRRARKRVAVTEVTATQITYCVV
jgi:hypothetical protein